MRYLTLAEVLMIYRKVMEQTGGFKGLRDPGALESCLAQPQMVYGGEEFYKGIVEKAGILCYLIVKNHPFIDGNKRAGHAVMETFLFLNGYEIEAGTDEQEEIILNIASGKMEKEEFIKWLVNNVKKS